MAAQKTSSNHYDLLQVKPTASPQEIRRAYRDLSKLYHPDTTKLAPEIATEKFQILNEAYATLSNPEKRVAYDYSVGISRVAVIQAPEYLNQPASQRSYYEKSNAYLDPTDRALSAGELFALFILGVTFVGCLLLVVTIGWTKGELVLQPTSADRLPTTEVLEAPSTAIAAPEMPAPQPVPSSIPK
ncbi:MAG: J domain-containing protein [Cyanobacteria bacterium J06559_1]